METLEYNGYEGTAEVDTDRLLCRGKILFIRDLVTYESDTPTGLEQEFRAAVDDYLETCKELGKEPDRPFRGQFNVRVPPELHRAAALRAIRENISINEIVVKALDAFLCASSEVSHHVHVTITDPAQQFETLTYAASDNSEWKLTGHAH